MRRAFFIALNEVKLYLQDKGDLAFSLLLPIVTFALIYGAFGGQMMFETTAYVVDEDKGTYSSVLLEQLEAVEGVEVELLTQSEADTKLERSDILLRGATADRKARLLPVSSGVLPRISTGNSRFVIRSVQVLRGQVYLKTVLKLLCRSSWNGNESSPLWWSVKRRLAAVLTSLISSCPLLLPCTSSSP